VRGLVVRVWQVVRTPSGFAWFGVAAIAAIEGAAYFFLLKPR
jgi:hypothetical protein